MSRPSDDALTARIQELESQLSLLQRANLALQRDNADLVLGRETLLERLELLESAGRGTTSALASCQNCLRETDHWLLRTPQADYSSLRQLLEQQNWEAADCETQRLMLQVAGPEAQSQGFLSSIHLDSFPCTDLRIINKLWTVYSSGKYGFLVQREIWARTHSTLNLWQSPEFDGYYPMREGLGHSLAKRLQRCAFDCF